MACGCGGSTRKAAAQKPPREALKGPKAPNYYWEGPKRSQEWNGPAKKDRGSGAS